MSESREAFEQTFSKFKSEFVRGLIEFGEGKRANRLVKEIDDNQLDYAHFFEAAWQAQQSKIDTSTDENNSLKELVSRIKAIKSIDSEDLLYIQSILTNAQLIENIENELASRADTELPFG